MICNSRFTWCVSKDIFYFLFQPSYNFFFPKALVPHRVIFRVGVWVELKKVGRAKGDTYATSVNYVLADVNFIDGWGKETLTGKPPDS